MMVLRQRVMCVALSRSCWHSWGYGWRAGPSAARCCAVTAAEFSGVVQVMGEMDPDELENGDGEATHGNSDAGHDIGSLTGWQAIAAGVRC